MEKLEYENFMYDKEDIETQQQQQDKKYMNIINQAMNVQVCLTSKQTHTHTHYRQTLLGKLFGYVRFCCSCIFWLAFGLGSGGFFGAFA